MVLDLTTFRKLSNLKWS